MQLGSLELRRVSEPKQQEIEQFEREQQEIEVAGKRRSCGGGV